MYYNQRSNLADTQPNRQFPLVSADIILPNLPVRALKTDFRILTEVARHDQAKQMGLAQRALKACDEIMNNFRRTKGDTDNGFEKVDEMIQRLREISWGVLGKLDEEGLKGTCVWDRGEREAKVWAIGHWYVRPIGHPPVDGLLSSRAGSTCDCELTYSHIDTAWLWRYTQTQQKVSLNSSSGASTSNYYSFPSPYVLSP